jgi:hypothetical protein
VLGVEPTAAFIGLTQVGVVNACSVEFAVAHAVILSLVGQIMSRPWAICS